MKITTTEAQRAQQLRDMNHGLQPPSAEAIERSAYVGAQIIGWSMVAATVAAVALAGYVAWRIIR